MRYEMAVPAALAQQGSPNTQSIVTATISLQDQRLFFVDDAQFVAFITELKKPIISNESLRALLENHRGSNGDRMIAATLFKIMQKGKVRNQERNAFSISRRRILFNRV